MTSNLAPGAPLPLSANPLTEVVAEYGKYDDGDGVRIILQGDQMIFMAQHQGNEIEIVVEIMQVLEAVGRHNAKIGS